MDIKCGVHKQYQYISIRQQQLIIFTQYISMSCSKFTHSMFRNTKIVLAIFIAMQVALGSSCSNNAYFFNPATNKCQPCNSKLYGCYGCSFETGLLRCTVCWNGYHLIDGQCLSCPGWCQTCDILAGQLTCLQCSPVRYYVLGSICEECPPGCNKCNNYGGQVLCTQCLMFDSSSLDKCPSCPPNCYACKSDRSIQCTICYYGFYVQGGECKECRANCKICKNNLECSNCELDHHILPDKMTCARNCDSLACEDCPNNASECVKCPSGFEIQPGNTCDICGDSQVIDLPCDLPLGISNDGCTDLCQIEENYQCSNSGIFPKISHCWFVGSESKNFIQFVSSDKDTYLFQNKIQLLFEIGSIFPSHEAEEDLRKLFAFNDSMMTIEEIEFDLESLRLSILVSYSQDIEGRPYSLYFQPSTQISSSYLYSPSAQYNGTVSSTSSMFKAIAYPDNLYATAKAIMAFSIIICFLSYSACIVAAFSAKLAGIEIMFVIQYTWLMILWLPRYLPLPTYMMSYMRFTSGYNIMFKPSNPTWDSPQTMAFGLSDASFASNYNLVVVFTVVPLMLAIGYKIAYHRAQQADKLKTHENFRKWLQLQMYGCLFNLQYFVSCVVIYFKSEDLWDTSSLVLMAFQLSIYLITTARFIHKSASFERFRLQFGENQLKYNHYAFHLLNLVGSVLLLSLVSDQPWAPALPQFLFLFYTLIIAPYKSPMENLRSIFFIVLMLNATAFRAYVWYVQPDYGQFGQYGWLILMQLALLLGILWAVYQLWDYWKDKKNATHTKKDILDRFIEENMVRNQMTEQQKARTMMSVIPNDQTPLEYLQAQPDYDETSEVMRQKADKKQHTAQFDFNYIDSISPVKKRINKDKAENEESEQVQDRQGQLAGQKLQLKEEQKIELVTVLKETKVHFQLENAIEQGNRLKEYDNPLFMEEYDKIGKEDAISDCVELGNYEIELPETPKTLQKYRLYSQKDLGK